MSERERWIVYPLLFFALGAAIRDKILNTVESKQIVCTEMEAKRIRCEELVVIDPEGRTAGLAKLGSNRAVNGKRVGLLVLTDSDGQEFFGLADDELFMRRLRCQNLAIIDPEPPGRVVAALGVEQVTLDTDPPRTGRVGVLRLNSQATPVLPGVPNLAVAQPGSIPIGGPSPEDSAADDEAEAPSTSARTGNPSDAESSASQ